jgi:hypothetical protein
MVSESAARRVAKKAGLVAKKSRWRKDSIDNQGGFMLIEPRGNYVVNGEKFDMSADEVVEFCKKQMATA